MPLFTLLADYRGGTYIRQITAASPVSALLNWCKETGNTIPKSLASALKQLGDERDQAIQIEGCKNVWCLSTTYRGSLLLLHIVKTEKVQPYNGS
jgi:hypothetical protein